MPVRSIDLAQKADRSESILEHNSESIFLQILQILPAWEVNSEESVAMNEPNLQVRVAIDAWAKCWENVLCLAARLPPETVSDGELFTAASRLVHVCRFETDDCAIDGFESELENARHFVAEQRSVNPRDLEWQRIEIALAGAGSALAIAGQRFSNIAAN